MQFILPGLAEGEDFLAERDGHRTVMTLEQRVLIAVIRDEHRVNAVGAGARHQADKMGVTHSTDASCCALRRLASCWVGWRIEAR